MLLSIIGNILGGDGGSSGNSGDDLMGGDPSATGSTSDQGLMPGGSSSGGMDGGEQLSDGGGMSLDDGGDDMSFDDGGGDMSFDDGGGDMSFDDAGGGGVSSELESRIDEMENDVGSLSSTVNTVQSENEKISESLDEIEEDIRKLLEVYEMVTQGVNPFVEGDSLSETMGAGGGGFGGESLFDEESEGEEGEMGDDVANAEAEEFLDESIMDEGEDDLDDEFGDGLDDDFDDDLGMGDDEMGDDEDVSFDDLKSEYEEGDDDFEDESDMGLDDEPDMGLDEDPDMGLDDEPDVGAESEGLGGELADSEPQPAPTNDVPWDDGGRPYLEEIPSEYDTEYVVMDWLDYLVEKAGLNGAARTIRFYQEIGWIGEPVDECLQTMLNGFDGGADVEDPEPQSSLGVDHKRSLWRISQISTPAKQRRSFTEWLDEEGISTRKTIEVHGTGQSEPDTAGTDTSDETGDDPDASSDTELTYSEDELDEPTATEPTPESGAEMHTEPDSGPESEADSVDESSDDDSDNAVNVAVGVESEEDKWDRDDESGFGEMTPEEFLEDDVNGDREQMVWVDSDVMKTESGANLHEGYYGYSDQDEYEKPILVPEEQTDLEPWQVEFINSVLISDQDYE